MTVWRIDANDVLYATQRYSLRTHPAHPGVFGESSRCGFPVRTSSGIRG